ncbi:uncharacterized protein J8A68_001130 [[Candida] subhashii]|uniref:Phosphatidic acid phosphatase type 2/haloperoxidase domain-containing protein n=1 Tax=[Candida] subhashii TaxID=561895 RepID=A0A8J5QLT8_9ASCO|nr:uncharacterized protein J8A68_001130 [[Candida] subhashii]KAG7665442.1 hypothetical protein J8A68_001130 [[Candida] subhashii]
MQTYLNSSKFKKFIPDWITTVVLILLFFIVLEKGNPFPREFQVNDPRISHPFAEQERVTDNELYIYSTLLPLVIISLISLYLPSSRFDKLHLLQVSLLGLLFCVTITCCITDILKCWISNPRPDFLVRCGATGAVVRSESMSEKVLMSMTKCSAPLGQMYLLDGMKSTPSGHSSMSFAGLGYLSLWLVGQLRLLNEKKLQYLFVWGVVVGAPILFAAWIALTRTQDYRHHFVDIVIGAILGSAFALASYFKYFNSPWANDCYIPIDYDEY